MRWQTLVAAEELAERMGDPRLRLFDCRFDLARPSAGRERYLEGHLPGAVFADLNTALSASPTPRSGRHPLPTPAQFVAQLRRWGVDGDSQVVAYDDGSGLFAARLWWMLRWLGHGAAAVLDGGLRRWVELDLPVTREVPTCARTGSFAAREQADLVVDATGAAAAAADPSQRLLDARSPERYRGEVEPIDAVGGHVPGARNHPYTASLGADGRFLPPEALRRGLLAALEGVVPQAAVAMCGSGVTACHLLLAMEHAGLPGGRLYPGSWSEWSRDPSRPIATGPQP
ncbi:MAG TPA: sulfurtransferase [Steroidobacteraceae bacterium]|nr:sulfurtransferase [Steroidobacteraceae bacterium]